MIYLSIATLFSIIISIVVFGSKYIVLEDLVCSL